MSVADSQEAEQSDAAQGKEQNSPIVPGHPGGSGIGGEHRPPRAGGAREGSSQTFHGVGEKARGQQLFLPI